PIYGLVYLNSRQIGRLQKKGNYFFFETKDIEPGVYNVRVRLRFFRYWGLYPYYAWKKFSYIGFQENKTTTLIYQWWKNRDFGKKQKNADNKGKKKNFEVIE
ncbi:hypothetical protein ACFL35_06875, partial [Candidatus Riflebacteria bacterium]